MFLLIAFVLLVAGLVLPICDPFLQSGRVWYAAVACWIGAAMSLGIGIGKLF